MPCLEACAEGGTSAGGKLLLRNEGVVNAPLFGLLRKALLSCPGQAVRHLSASPSEFTRRSSVPRAIASEDGMRSHFRQLGVSDPWGEGQH